MFAALSPSALAALLARAPFDHVYAVPMLRWLWCGIPVLDISYLIGLEVGSEENLTLGEILSAVRLGPFRSVPLGKSALLILVFSKEIRLRPTLLTIVLKSVSKMKLLSLINTPKRS